MEADYFNRQHLRLKHKHQSVYNVLWSTKIYITLFHHHNMVA